MATTAPVLETLAPLVGGTPDEVERYRKLAEALLEKAASGEPVEHWMEGVGRLALALSSRSNERKAAQMEKGGEAEKWANITAGVDAGLFGGGGGEYADIPGAEAVSGDDAATMQYAGGAPPADAASVYQGMIKRGLTPAQAAAFAGNVQQESGFRPTSHNVGEGAHGIIQWREGRFNNLRNFAAKQGKPWTDINTQMDFALWEMQNTEAGAGQQLRNAQTVEDANRALKGYIRYGDESYGTRLNNARRIGQMPVGETADIPGAEPVGSEPSPDVAEFLGQPPSQPEASMTERQALIAQALGGSAENPADVAADVQRRYANDAASQPSARPVPTPRGWNDATPLPVAEQLPPQFGPVSGPPPGGAGTVAMPPVAPTRPPMFQAAQGAYGNVDPRAQAISAARPSTAGPVVTPPLQGAGSVDPRAMPTSAARPSTVPPVAAPPSPPLAARVPQPRPALPAAPAAPATTGTVAAPAPARPVYGPAVKNDYNAMPGRPPAAMPMRPGQLMQEPYSGPMSAQEFARQGQAAMRARRAGQQPTGLAQALQAPTPGGQPQQPRRNILQALLGRGGPQGAGGAQTAPAASAAPAGGTAAPMDPRRAAFARILADPRVPDALKIAALKNMTPAERKLLQVPAGGALVDPVTHEEVYRAPFKPEEPGVTTRPMTPEERKTYGIPDSDKRPWAMDSTGKPSVPGAGGVTVNTGDTPAAADATLREDLNKAEGKRWSALQERAVIAANTNQKLGVLDEVINMAPQGPVTGRLAAMFPEATTAGALFQSIVSSTAPTLRVEGSGSTSDLEYQGMLDSMAALKNYPEANRAITDTMRAKAQLDIERGAIVDAYMGNTMTADAARAALAELNKKSILSPELKRLIKGGETGGREKWNPDTGEIE